jgi:hypothetical protein
MDHNGSSFTTLPTNWATTWHWICSVQCRRAFDRRERGSACGFGPKSLGCSRCTLRWANGLKICLGKFSRPHCLPSLESWLIREIIPKRAEIKILQYTQICGHPEKNNDEHLRIFKGSRKEQHEVSVIWTSTCCQLGICMRGAGQLENQETWDPGMISVVFLGIFSQPRMRWQPTIIQNGDWLRHLRGM